MDETKSEKLTELLVALHQHLGLIQTAGQSTLIMAECLKLSDQCVRILQGKDEQ